MLSSPTDAGYLFYGLILLTLIVKIRPWRNLVAVLAGIVVFGFVAQPIVGRDLELVHRRVTGQLRLDRVGGERLGDRARRTRSDTATSCTSC